MGTSSLALKAALRKLADTQGGFFTASQAIAVGYKDSTHGYHVKNGDWERVGWGIYRLSTFPKDPWSELYRILLWSRDKSGVPQGVFCGSTADSIIQRDPESLDVSRIELCVPKSFRRSAPHPEKVVLFFEDLCEKDKITVEGLPVTRRVLYTKPNIFESDMGSKEAAANDMIARGED